LAEGLAEITCCSDDEDIDHFVEVKEVKKIATLI
jgi:hypothetical protein